MIADIEGLGRLATRRLEDSLTRSAKASVPRLARAMEAGYAREQNASALGHRIARIIFTCILPPPPVTDSPPTGMPSSSTTVTLRESERCSAEP